MKYTIAQTLENAERACIEAVEHVGAANYNEREREARQWVRQAFTAIKEAIKEEQ